SFSGLNGQGALHFGNGANSMTTTLTITTTGATPAGNTSFIVKAAASSSDFATGNGTLAIVPATLAISASSGANGSISPSGAVTVNYAASKTFTITANNGYHVADVLVDGGSVGAVTSYTIVACYQGISNFAASSGSLVQQVNPASSTTTVTCPVTAQPYTGAAQTPCTASYATADGLSGSLTPSYSNNVNVGPAAAS